MRPEDALKFEYHWYTHLAIEQCKPWVCSMLNEVLNLWHIAEVASYKAGHPFQDRYGVFRYPGPTPPEGSIFAQIMRRLSCKWSGKT